MKNKKYYFERLNYYESKFFSKTILFSYYLHNMKKYGYNKYYF